MKTSLYYFLPLGLLLLSFSLDAKVEGFTTNFLKRKLPTIPTLSLPFLPPIKLELLPAVEEANQDLNSVTEVPIASDEEYYLPTADYVEILRPTQSPTPQIQVETTREPNQPEPEPTLDTNRNESQPDEEEEATDLGNFIIKKLTTIERKIDQLQEELKKTQASLANQNANIEKMQPQTEENLSQFARMLSDNLTTRLGHLNPENVTAILAENKPEEASTRSTNLPSYPFGIPSLPSFNSSSITSTLSALPGVPFGGGANLPGFPPKIPSNRTDLEPPYRPVTPTPSNENGNDNPQAGTSGEDKKPASSYLDIDNYVPDVGLISDDPDRIKFLIFSNPNDPSEAETLEYGNVQSVQTSRYDGTKPVKFLVHGFQNNANSTFPQNVKNAYLAKNLDYNIIVVDWGALAIPNAPYIAPVFYPFAVKNVWRTGQRLGEFISWLQKEDLIHLDLVHIIGFSLGSHVSGKAGSVVQDTFNQSVARITALDPAGPEFYTGILARKLRVSDAKYVDAIHTNAGQLGIWADIGHADYFVNGGSGPQPGCIGIDSVTAVFRSVTNTISGTCSHIRATEVYAKTILTDDSRSDESKLLCSCDSVTNYKLNTCGCQRKVGFGEYTAPGTFGTHFIDYQL